MSEQPSVESTAITPSPRQWYDRYKFQMVPEVQMQFAQLFGRLDIIASMMQKAHLDEHAGDWTERAETAVWIATGGTEGRDWGCR